MFTAGSLVLISATLWLLATSPDSIRSEWGLAILAGSVLCGGVGLLVSLLYLGRNESGRVFGVLSSIVNVAAVVIPIIG